MGTSPLGSVQIRHTLCSPGGLDQELPSCRAALRSMEHVRKNAATNPGTLDEGEFANAARRATGVASSG